MIEKLRNVSCISVCRSRPVCGRCCCQRLWRCPEPRQRSTVSCSNYFRKTSIFIVSAFWTLILLIRVCITFTKFTNFKWLEIFWIVGNHFRSTYFNLNGTPWRNKTFLEVEWFFLVIEFLITNHFKIKYKTKFKGKTGSDYFNELFHIWILYRICFDNVPW